MDSPVGTIYVALARRDVLALTFTPQTADDFREGLYSRISKQIFRSNAMVAPLLEELQEYFEGNRTRFGFTPDLFGCTPFQKKVLSAAAGIPYGQTRSYGWLAGQAGSPRSARAVGQVMARNPVPIIIPCHRVVGSTGDLCGFGGGAQRLDLKRKLLAIEGIEA
jgi:O-6-methylguanine DNA methyltransferase